MTGVEAKAMILESGLKCWEVAEAWGLSDGNFSRRLRKPFNEADSAKLKGIVTELCRKKGYASESSTCIA